VNARLSVLLLLLLLMLLLLAVRAPAGLAFRLSCGRG
jgi:hypothetical protein